MQSHIVAAAKEVLSQQCINEVKHLAKEIMQQFVFFDLDAEVSRADKIHLYTSQLMTCYFGMHLMLEYKRVIVTKF